MTARKARLVAAAMVALGAGLAPERVPEAGAARAVLGRMAATYAAARSYRDSGVVRTEFVRDGKMHAVEKPFATAFVRPGHFRFEFRDGHEDGPEARRFVVWTDSAPRRAKRWWTLAPEVREDRLDLTLAGGGGISGGSAWMVPKLLMPEEVRAWSLAELEAPILNGTEPVEGATCVRIRGRSPQGETVTLWIEPETGLLRRVAIAHDFGDFQSEDTTTYHPALDVPIEAERFRFEPPK